MQPDIKYELLEFEKLIGAEPTSLSSKQFKALQLQLSIEVERIKQKLIYEVFTFEDERHLERYIQYHQQALIRLIDKAPNANIQTEDKRLPEMGEVISKKLTELLIFVERHFTKYFDQDAKAPEGYVALARKEALANSKRFLKALTALNANTQLIALMLHVLKKIGTTNPEQRITYRKVMYAKELQKELTRLITLSEHTNINEELRQSMYYLNYNSIRVITYHAHFFSALLNEAETRAEKIEKLSLEFKKINQAQVKPGVAYNPNMPPIKSQLGNYITEEMDYQERLQQLASITPSNQPNPFPGFKLKFDASVAQLAYLLKLLFEMKIILNSNLTRVLHFLTSFAITKRAETISYTSLRAKFYNVETGTKSSVRNLLTSMIQYIDKN